MIDAATAGRIVVVDDNEAVRYATSRILRGAGWEVFSAGSGSEALECARSVGPDVMLLDVKLPDIDGLEVARRLKSGDDTSSIMLLQTSATYVGSADRVRGLEGGADHYLVQPFEPEELIASVRALLRVRKAERELRRTTEEAQRTARRLAEQNVRLSMLASVSAELLRGADAPVMLGRAYARVAEGLGLAGAALFTLDADGVPRLEWAAGRMESTLDPRRQAAIASSLCAPVLTSHQPVGLVDLGECGSDTEAALTALGIGAWACTPLLAGERLVGVLAFGRRERSRFTEPELEALGLLANYLALARERLGSALALQESEGRYRALAESVPQIVFTTTPEGALEYVNGRWREATGAPTERALNGGWTDFVHPDDRLADGERWAAALADAHRYESEYRLRQVDGSFRWHLARAIPYRDAGSRILRWIGTSTDIEDRKRAEFALTEADQRKDEFLAMLAHELRNPLAPIGNAVELLRRTAGAEPQVHWARDMIDRQVAHMRRLLDDLLDVARITHKRIVLKEEVVDIAQVVQNAVEASRAMFDARGQVLEVDVPDVPLRVRGDLVRLSQVVANLLNNSAKYTPDGGRIELRVEGDDPAAITICVRDNGIGIAPELLPHVFALFTQGDRSLNRSEGGLGVGLALVHRLVEQHNGSVYASSAGPGQGSEFVVRLPRLQADAAGAAAAAEPQAGSSTALRVLVVDDNVDSAESLASLLEFDGHTTRVAHDGREGLAQALAFVPDVALLDIGLPLLDGYQVARRLRADPRTASVVLVALTGYGDSANRLKSRAAGFAHHLVKPVVYASLQTVLAEVSAASMRE